MHNQMIKLGFLLISLLSCSSQTAVSAKNSPIVFGPFEGQLCAEEFEGGEYLLDDITVIRGPTLFEKSGRLPALAYFSNFLDFESMTYYLSSEEPFDVNYSVRYDEAFFKENHLVILQIRGPSSGLYAGEMKQKSGGIDLNYYYHETMGGDSIEYMLFYPFSRDHLSSPFDSYNVSVNAIPYR